MNSQNTNGEGVPVELQQLIHDQLYDLINGNDMQLSKAVEIIFPPYKKIVDAFESYLTATLQELQRENEELRKYVTHNEDCSITPFRNNSCTCGLTKLLTP